MYRKRKEITIFIKKDQIDYSVWNKLAQKDYWNIGIDYADQDITVSTVDRNSGSTSPQEIKVFDFKTLLNLDNRYSNYDLEITDSGIVINVWELSSTNTV